ncbi:MAG: T9SS type A sorting domain-containing protein [Bacteroidota bacterium]
MKKLLLFSALIFIVRSVSSQNWCPPGATWYYRANQPFSSTPYYDGHVKLQVTNTVTINGVTCQNMDGVFTGVHPLPSSPVNSFNIINIKTYENNGVVFLYNSYTQLFDTIANFNANVGDKWLKIHFVPMANCQSGTRLPITVTATGSMTINNISLRTLTLSVPFSNSSSYTITMIERIMNVNGFLFPWNGCQLDSPPYGDFTCYSDNNFPIYNPTSAVCAYIPTGIGENSISGSDLKLYPNPTGGDLSLDLHVASRLSIFNAVGTLVQSMCVDHAGTVNINGGALAPGIYFLKMENASENGWAKFVKE